MPAWWLGAVCNAELPVVIATLMSTVNGVAVSTLTVPKSTTGGSDPHGRMVISGPSLSIQIAPPRLICNPNSPESGTQSQLRTGDAGNGVLPSRTIRLIRTRIAQLQQPVKEEEEHLRLNVGQEVR